MNIKVVTHYAEDDPECIADHIGGEVFVDGERVFVFADAYHERSTYTEGFIAGIEYMLENFLDGRNVEVENVGAPDGVQVW